MGDSSAANPATLSAAFAGLFPSGVVAAELRAPADAAQLLPEEAACVSKQAVPKRMREFTGGRLCARRALEEFRVCGFPVRMAGDRQPLWPEPLIGSITHTTGLCAAAVAERRRLRALGLDTELADAAKEDLWPTLCTAAELAWIETLPRLRRSAAVTLIFSAKEAFYKCQYPLAGEWLNFHDVSVAVPEWGAAQGSFDIVPTRPIKLHELAPGPVPGSFRFHEEFVSAGVWLPAL